MHYYSPLRYPGGKAKLSDYLKLIFEKNKLCDGVYIEPYAGGASIALSLLFNEYAKEVIINDIDRSIYAFWHSVLNKTDEFCDRIEKAELNILTWKKQKEIQLYKKSKKLLDVGFSTFYLNRTNRSGVINGGVIGGLDQIGNWKIDARFNKQELIKRIEKIATFKDRIRIFNVDAFLLLNDLNKNLPSKSLIYLDPPYYLKGKDLYVNFYKHEDHLKISTLLSSKLANKNWIVSYDYTPEIVKMYANYSSIKYDINYSVINGTKGKEIMIFNSNLLAPNVIVNN